MKKCALLYFELRTDLLRLLLQQKTAHRMQSQKILLKQTTIYTIIVITQRSACLEQELILISVVYTLMGHHVVTKYNPTAGWPILTIINYCFKQSTFSNCSQFSLTCIWLTFTDLKHLITLLLQTFAPSFLLSHSLLPNSLTSLNISSQVSH